MTPDRIQRGVLRSLPWVLWRLTLPFCVSLLRHCVSLKRAQERAAGFSTGLSRLPALLSSIPGSQRVLEESENPREAAAVRGEPGNAHSPHPKGQTIRGPLNRTRGYPGRHGPRAPGLGPGISLQDGDLPARRAQPTATPHTSATNSPVPGSGRAGPEPARRWPRRRPGGAKREVVRAAAAGKPSGGSARRLCLARPRDELGRPPPGPRRRLLYPSVLAAGSSGAPGGQSSRGRGASAAPAGPAGRAPSPPQGT